MKGGRFGTLGGVFTPCTLTILGVIMFLRFGQVVGQSGVWYALSIVALAKLITTLTTLSLSAIATNTRVKAGGAYYLISRSLGVEFGGSIGLIFFLAQAVSVSLYVIGFTEVLLSTFPEAALDPRTVGTVVNVAVFVCVLIGAGWAIKVQYVILGVLGVSLLSFFIGAIMKADGEVLRENLGAGFAEGSGYWTMFALFFPAATGIMAGANMSGDLKNPARSIPKGTLLSILVTALVYLAMAVALAASADRQTLLEDSFVVKSVAVVGVLVTLGVFAATLSSAIGSLMGAPRILQALARDEIFHQFSFFGRGSGPNDEPRRAVVLTFLLAQGGVMLGDLDLIAPIITMFFMITYGYLNLATFYESITKNPSYRPRFRFSHWSTALLGTIGCGAVMILISPLWALVSIAATAALHRYLERQNVIATWGDLKSGAAFERARKSLLKLEDEKYHPKNWRPSVLALGGGDRRQHLAVYGNWLTVGRGLLTLAQVIPGDSDTHLRRRAREEKSLRAFVREAELDAFTAVLVAPKLSLGIEALVQCYGIGALRPNVLLLGWLTDPGKRKDWGTALRTIRELERSIVLMRAEPDDVEDPWELSYGSVDVWWRGQVNGALMLLLAHLLAANAAWRGKRVRLLRVIGNEAGREEATAHLQHLIEEARIEATPVVVVSDDPAAAIRETSASAAIVLLGFEPPKAGMEESFVENMNRLMEGLGTTLLVWSSGDVRLEA